MNDDLSDANFLSLPDIVSGTTVNATIQPGVLFDTDSSVWYQYTAESSENLRITLSGVDSTHFVRLFEGSLLNVVSSVLAGEDSPNSISFEATAGNTYYFTVFPGSLSPEGPFTLSLSRIGAIGSSYNAWISSFPLTNLDPNADPDGDGILSILEFAANTDPSARTFLADIISIAQEDLEVLVVSYRRRLNDLDINYNLETSTTLEDWSVLSEEFPTLTSSNEEIDSETEIISVQVPLNSFNGEAFFRVNAQE